MQVTFQVRFSTSQSSNHQDHGHFYARAFRAVNLSFVPPVQSKISMIDHDSQGAAVVVDVVYPTKENQDTLVFANCSGGDTDDVDKYLLVLEDDGWEFEYNPAYDEEAKRFTAAMAAVESKKPTLTVVVDEEEEEEG